MSAPSTPSPRETTKSQKVVQLPDFGPDDIPRILGKGGFNVRNLVKYSTKKWYDNHSDGEEGAAEKARDAGAHGAPHIKLNLLHDEEKGVHFFLESSCELMVSCAVEAITEFLVKLKKNPKKNTRRNHSLSDKTMKQIFRVEMDPTMLGKLIGKKGSRVQEMVKFVVNLDDDKNAAKTTKIFVKEETAKLAGDKCIDLDEFGDGSEKYVLFIATVSTTNLYKTMRNVEKAIGKNINRSSFDVSTYEDESAQDRKTAKEMFEEAEDFNGAGW